MSVGSFGGLNTALRGLLANQRSLDVTAHNIANAETPGYSRQEAVLATAPSLNLQAGAVLDGYGAQLGQGVQVETYRRMRDDFLDLQYRAQNMSKGGADATAAQLDQIQDVLGESADTGIGVQLDKFWSSWQDLAANPESSTAKAAVLGRAQSLTDAFKSLDGSLASIATNATGQVDQILSPAGPVAQAATELAKLNDAIRRATQAGVAPNDALDRRDLLLDQLSQYGQVSVTPDLTPGNDGMVTVSFGGATTPLVSATTATVPTAAQLNNPGGSLGALQTVAGTTVPGYRAALDTLAAGVISAVNTAHPTAVFSGTSAATMTVTAAPGSIVAGTGAAADNGVARALAAQRGGAADTGYAGLVRQIGGDAASALTSQRTAESVVGSLTERRQSVAGVSMDEEMTNMVRFQRGYQAAARVLSTMDEALDTLINRTGRVGL